MIESVQGQSDLRVKKSCEKLHEHISDWQSEASAVDREQMQVLSIALAGPNSRNGYLYTEKALREALPLYESRPVFLDHAVNSSRPHERSTRDLVGSIMNVRFEQGRIRGDIQVLDTESGRTFLALAEKKTEFVGMSHVILARRSADKKTVEKIEEVISVDAVVFPATTSTFQEQISDLETNPIAGSFEAAILAVDAAMLETPVLQQEGWNARVAMFDDVVVLGSGEQEHSDAQEQGISPDAEETTYALVEWSWRDDGLVELSEIMGMVNQSQLTDGTWREDGAQIFGKNVQANELTGVVESELDLELRMTKGQLASASSRYGQLLKKYIRSRKRQKKEARIEQLIAESQLPEKAMTEEFRTVLYEAKNDQARKCLLRDRRWLCSDLQRSAPYSVAREVTGGGSEQLDEVFIQAVKS